MNKAKELESKVENFFRHLARDQWHEEGECEIDDMAEVSPAEDGSGAYVQAWVWVGLE